MDIIWIILAFLLVLIGLLGAIIPGLPGPPVAWLALIVLNLTEKISYTTEFFAITALFAIAITLLDYYVPIYGTKKFGGTKAGVWGSTIGMPGDRHGDRFWVSWPEPSSNLPMRW